MMHFYFNRCFNKVNIKKLVLVWLIACFTLNTTVVAAMQVCHESTMAPTEMSDTDVPCHEAEKNTTEQVSMQQADAQDHSADCHSFSCGHCQLLTQISLLNTSPIGLSPADHTNYTPYDDINVSAIIDGIDYPPKCFA